MAITKFDEGPNLGGLFGAGLGSGITKGLEQLAQKKMQDVQKRNMFNSLVGANVPPNVAVALVNNPRSLQTGGIFDSLLGLQGQGAAAPGGQQPIDQQQQLGLPGQQLGRQQQTQAPVEGQSDRIEQLLKIRMKNIKRMKRTGRKSSPFLPNANITPKERAILTGNKLNEVIVQYFLSKTNNNPQKARRLAKKFGYEV